MTVQAVCAGLWTGLGSPGTSSLGETQPGTHTFSLVGPEGGLRETREKSGKASWRKGHFSQSFGKQERGEVRQGQSRVTFGDYPLHLRTGLRGQVLPSRSHCKVQQSGPGMSHSGKQVLEQRGTRGWWVAGAAAPAFEASESWRFYPRLRLPEDFSWPLLRHSCVAGKPRL